jgi:hypothetical protein
MNLRTRDVHITGYLLTPAVPVFMILDVSVLNNVMGCMENAFGKMLWDPLLISFSFLAN